jgi:hypothetical protein
MTPDYFLDTLAEKLYLTETWIFVAMDSKLSL